MSAAKPIIEATINELTPGATYAFDYDEASLRDEVTVAGWTEHEYNILKQRMNSIDPFFWAEVNKFYRQDADGTRGPMEFNMDFRDTTHPVRELWGYFGDSDKTSVFLSNGESIVRFRDSSECLIWERMDDEELEDEFDSIYSECREYPQGRADDDSMMSGWEIVKDDTLGIDLSSLIH